MPPFTLGIQIPGAITDARGLLGGLATTGAYIQANGGAGGVGGKFLDVTPGGVPTGGRGGGGGGGGGGIPGGFGTPQGPNRPASGVYGNGGFNADQISNAPFRRATPTEIAKSRLDPLPPGKHYETDGSGAFTVHDGA